MEAFHLHAVLMKICCSQCHSFFRTHAIVKRSENKIFGGWFRFSVEMKKSVRRHILICIRRRELFYVSAYTWL